MVILASTLLSAYQPTGAQGIQGRQGITGSTGASVGFPYVFSTTTTASDPGVGFFRFNSGTTGSVTEMYISSTDYTAVSRSGALLVLDDTPGTSRATLYIPSVSGGGGFGISLTVTGNITDNGTWLTIPVLYSSGGLPPNNDIRSVVGVRNGVQGIQGITGSQGIQGITGSIADGDKGDITVSGAGATLTIDALVVTPAKMVGTGSTTGQALVSTGAATAPAYTTLTLENLPDAWVKRSCRVATTANITLSGTQTIDGIGVVAGDRVLVKNQTTQANNGIYVVAAGAWARADDASTASELAAATVGIDSGTTNGGLTFDSDFKSTDTLGTTAMNWFAVMDSNRLITAGSTSTASIVNYNGTTAAAGQFDGGTTTPSGTTRLNYGGNFYPTTLNLLGTADTATAASHYYIETASDGFIRPKTLANAQTEIVTSAVLGTGAANGTTYLRGDRTWATVAAGSGALSTKETVLTTGTAATFTRDTNTLFAEVYCTGGGGGGGGADSDATSMSGSGGGGGGGTAIIWYTATEMGATATYTVGTGGIAGTAAGGDGGAGNNSTFNVVGAGADITGSAGAGGIGTGSAYGNFNGVFNGGAGGSASNGQVNTNGLPGGKGFGFGSSTTVGSMFGGDGGASFWGGGGIGPVRNNSAGSAAGANAVARGAGGSGAVNNDNTTGVVGGTGQGGLILVIEYLSV